VAAYSKLAAGTFTPMRARLGLQVGGSAAVTWSKGDDDGNRPSTNYLNGRIIAIAAGTNEMQRNGIGERVLGLPREPSFDTAKPFNEVLKASRNWSGRVD
jgi:alkylation response protein AidB-like acyl-CoA dehydrogenase